MGHKNFVFIDDDAVIKRLEGKSTPEEFRNNVLPARGEESKKFFGSFPTDKSASEGEKAAIAMALHLYFAEVHDTESYCLTIRQNTNSAWNSKIYGMNNLNK